VARIGLFSVPEPKKLRKMGGSLLDNGRQKLQSGGGALRQGYLERSNVEPAVELTQLMDAQRQLEANANMIRFQDQMLSRLVNDVGKIG
jgi:flagellar basal body rod protein FlgG